MGEFHALILNEKRPACEKNLNRILKYFFEFINILRLN